MERILLFLGISFILPLLMILWGSQIKNGWAEKKKVNSHNGYRTKMSMKNQETWLFAHKYWGSLLLQFGFLLLIFTGGIALFVGRGTFILGELEPWLDGVIMGTITAVIQLLVFVALIIPTEKALRKEFDKNGVRIS